MASPSTNSVLVVDDEAGMRLALKANFQRKGWVVDTADGIAEAERKLRTSQFSLVVTDVRMPDGDGLQLMRRVRLSAPKVPVILLTAFGNVAEAVQAMRGGACDYLMKPVSFDQLQMAVNRVLQAPIERPAVVQEQESPIVGTSAGLVRALDRARHCAKTEADILIESESGTGKELFARMIHDLSTRRARPFIAVNCAAVPEHLLESELFGHVRGAFTGAEGHQEGKFAAADGGTLLLDEIGEMPLALQPKLLRALQEREFDRLGAREPIKVNIRVIATTNVSLLTLVEKGRFRADLFYRLNVIPLRLPPLRDRKDDIPALANSFARKFASQCGVTAPRLNPDFIEALQHHNWPGNVRELANLVHRLVALYEGAELSAEQLTDEFRLHQEPKKESKLSVQPGMPMRVLEKRLLEATLDATQGNRTHAAEMLGVSLRTIRNKIREYGLPPRSYARA